VADALVELNPKYVAEPVAARAFALAKAAYEAGEFAEAATLEANYLRRADAEMLAKQKAAQLAGRIRLAVSQDAESLAELSEMAPEAAQWSAREYERMLQPVDEGEAVRRWIYVLAEGSQLQGLIVVKLLGPEAEIENLVVRREARRRGMGRALCATALQALSASGAQTVELEVRESNGAATGLYAELGFERTGRRRDYYRNPREDALLLRVELPWRSKRGERLIMEAHG
jgi:ribosomal-protein-alanine N-acetyltransferase